MRCSRNCKPSSAWPTKPTSSSPAIRSKSTSASTPSSAITFPIFPSRAVPACSSKSVQERFFNVRFRSLDRDLADILGTALVPRRFRTAARDACSSAELLPVRPDRCFHCSTHVLWLTLFLEAEHIDVSAEPCFSQARPENLVWRWCHPSLLPSHTTRFPLPRLKPP